MKITKDITYICQNPACRKEIQKGNVTGKAPHCCTCGAEMKKAYSKPVARKWVRQM